jgi:hypothetical protein
MQLDVAFPCEYVAANPYLVRKKSLFSYPGLLERNDYIKAIQTKEPR